MSAPIIAFFNNKGGVGKTSLAYHIACMFADEGSRVIVADFDPQANLTSMFLDDDRLEALWPNGDHNETVHGAIRPLIAGTGDLVKPFQTIEPEENIGLIAGDLFLGDFEDELSQVWPACMNRQERAFRVTSALYRLVRDAVDSFDARMAIIDLGPNLGAINRAALIAASHVVVPVAPDLYSLQGLRNLGPTLRRWREDWTDRLERRPSSLPESVLLPEVGITPIGYVVLQHAIRRDRPTTAYGKWAARIPGAYARHILGEPSDIFDAAADHNCLALIKHYRSLMPLAQDARKPIFRLKPADGALGAHLQAAISAGTDINELAKEIAARSCLPPGPVRG